MGVTASQPSFVPSGTSRLRHPPSPAAPWFHPDPDLDRPYGLAAALLPCGWERVVGNTLSALLSASLPPSCSGKKKQHTLHLGAPVLPDVLHYSSTVQQYKWS